MAPLTILSLPEEMILLFEVSRRPRRGL
jgi:hypothetical protein